MDSINNIVRIPDTCDSGAEIRRNKAGNDCEHVCGERGRSVRKGDKEMLSAAGNGEESASTKERVLLVEKEGCATVVMYGERHTAHVFLADGTAITGSNQGAYQACVLQQMSLIFPVIIAIVERYLCAGCHSCYD